MKVIFVQPFNVSAAIAEQTTGNVVVLDVAFNAGSPASKLSPEEQFASTTLAFIETLGNRLLGWVDHHPHAKWSTYTNDVRFHLVPRNEASACPPLITPKLVAQIDPKNSVETVIAHGDFDGVMSAIKFLNRGIQPYPEADADSIAADSRVGSLSQQGQFYESAMKANLADDQVRQAIVALNTFREERSDEELQQAAHIVQAAVEKYAYIQAETQRLVAHYCVEGKVAWVDATEAAPFDLTQLLLAGQEVAQVALVRNQQRGTTQITIAGPGGSNGWNFVKLFRLTGGMPNRVNLPNQAIESLINTINNA